MMKLLGQRHNLTINELIEIFTMNKVSMNTQISLMGSSDIFIHYDDDRNIIILDEIDLREE